MKRNTKPFTVEIKKSRVQGQIHQLPPKRLFEPTPIEPGEFFQTEEVQSIAELTTAPRILPSIVEPVWSSAKPSIEPVRCALSSKQDNREQMELDLSAAPAEAHSTVPMIAEAMSQADMRDLGEDKAPIQEVRLGLGDSSKKERKSRKKRAEVVGQVTQPEPTSRPERVPEPAILEVAVPPSADAIRRRRTKRLAEAAQLPRSERWKRRLHPASR